MTEPLGSRSLAEWRAAVGHAWTHREFEGEEISYLLDEIERLRQSGPNGEGSGNPRPSPESPSPTSTEPGTEMAAFKAMLDRAKVVYRGRFSDRPGFKEIEIFAGAGPFNVGYNGFLTSFLFNPIGELAEVGVYE